MNGESDGFQWLEYSNLFLQCGIPLFLVALGWLVGSTVERNHLRSLKRREKHLFTIPINDLKTVPPGITAGHGTLITGSVVVASDYFKTFAASLRKLIGGEVHTFERLMFRARGEAMCRLMQAAHQQGALAVINVRIETSNIGGMRRSPSPMVEVIAYGTAVLPPSSQG